MIGDASGLPVASLVRGPKTLVTTAIATLAFSAASKVTDSLALPPPEDILIEAGPWIVVVTAFGEGFTLSCVFPVARDLGNLRLLMRLHAPEIFDVLKALRWVDVSAAEGLWEKKRWDEGRLSGDDR